jgi:hypothetical protein
MRVAFGAPPCLDRCLQGGSEIQEEAVVAPYDLRPLSLGEILDRVFTLYRNHFALFVGVMAIPAAVQIPTNMYSFGMWGKIMRMDAGHPPPFDPGMFAMIYLVVFPVIVVVVTLALGAIALAVSDVYLGRVATIRGSYHKALRRFWRLLGLLITIGFIVIGIAIVFSVAIALAAGVLAASGGLARMGTGGAIALVLLFVLVFLVASAVAIFFCMVFSLVIPALLLEDATIGGALRRSIELTRGRRWHIFMGVLLMVFISYAVVLIFQGPFLVGMFLFLLKGGPPLWLTLGTSLSAACGSAISSPLMMIALVLYYYDQRVRKEGFDLQHMIAQIENAPQPAPLGVIPS